MIDLAVRLVSSIFRMSQISVDLFVAPLIMPFVQVSRDPVELGKPAKEFTILSAGPN